LVGSIVDRNLSNPVGHGLILNSHEKIKGIYHCYEVVSNSSGRLILTSQRVVMSPKFGQGTSISLDQIAGVEAEHVLLSGRSQPALALYANKKFIFVLGPTEESPDSIEEVAQAIQELSTVWRTRSQERKVVNVNIDFADLREYIDHGGFVIRELKCPSCGSPFPIPEQGSTTRCKYCGATLVAEDVFAKLKQLLE
jgi:hypothetical protein